MDVDYDPGSASPQATELAPGNTLGVGDSALGVPGAVEVLSIDADGDGDAEGHGWDTNGDGLVDEVTADLDADGRDDFSTAIDTGVLGEPDSLPVPPVDLPVDSAGRAYFDPATATAVIGNPGEDLANWHEQTGPTCGVISQEFVLESVTGQDWSEDQLVAESLAQGWYIPDVGNPWEHVGKLLELHGVGVETSIDNDYSDLVSALESDQKVIVGLDADEVWAPGRSPEDDMLDDRGIPGNDANHLLQVAGIDISDPAHPMVILNDSGSPGGQGVMIPVEEFMDAWADADHYMLTTTGGPPTNDHAHVGPR